jgi:hypothetical protein
MHDLRSHFLSFSSDSSVFKKKAIDTHLPDPRSLPTQPLALAHLIHWALTTDPSYMSFLLSIWRVHISFATRTPRYLIKKVFTSPNYLNLNIYSENLLFRFIGFVFFGFEIYWNFNVFSI